jgi:DNA-binding transcriptional LysR family regulator
LDKSNDWNIFNATSPSSFAQNYPQIDLKVQVNSTRIIANNILNREIDIAVVGGEI